MTVSFAFRRNLSFRLRLRILTRPIRVAYIRAFRPYLLWPDQLDGYDGEAPHFLRHDLAKNETAVLSYLREQWGADAGEMVGYEVDEVWMKPGPAQRECEDDWYVVVPEGTPGSLRYWRVS